MSYPIMYQRRERVYYDATDAMGVVYHARYFQFMERARSDWLRSAGKSSAQLVEELNIMFVVARLTSRFRKPARLDDELTVTVELMSSRGASMDFFQRVLNEAGEVLCSAEVRLGCVRPDTLQPAALPESIKIELQQLIAAQG